MVPRLFDTEVAIAAHERFQRSLPNKPPYSIRPSFTQDCSPSVPLHGLRSMSLTQLHIDVVHHGAVLFGTLCVDPFMITAVMSVIADRDDPRVGVPLAIYNAATHRSTLQDLCRLFPKGCRIAVKEPYLKRVIDGRLAIRVDNPANIERLDEIEAAPHDATASSGDPHELREQGNALFAKGDWEGAISSYTNCITSLLEQEKVSGTSQDEKEKINSSLVMAYSNRAQACLKLGSCKDALADVDVALAIDPKNVKSLFRRGQALNGLMEYEEASSCLQELLAEHPELKEARALLNTVKSRLANPAEILPGFSAFLLGNKPPPKLPDYIGPVEIMKTTDGRGRGLFATRDMEPGELLILSNAAAVCSGSLTDFGFHVDLGTNTVNMTSQEDLVTELISLGIKSKGFLRMLYSLAASPSQETMEVPPMDLFTSPSVEVDDGLAVDVTRIRQIVRYNSFGSQIVGQNKVPECMDKEVSTSGLWLLPSFMNHSCLPNACRLHVGHAMVVHAASRIPAGQEITISYQNPLVPLKMREEMIKNWGFLCKCKRCDIERKLQSRLEGLTAQFQSIHAEATRHFGAFAADPNNQHDFYAACFELNCLFKKLKKKIRSMERLTDAEKKLVLASYSSGFLGRWFFSWAAGKKDGLPESGTEMLEVMRSCLPGNSATFCMVARLALAARQAGSTRQSVPPDYLMEQAKQECACLYGKQKASTVEELVERAAKVMPFIF